MPQVFVRAAIISLMADSWRDKNHGSSSIKDCFLIDFAVTVFLAILGKIVLPEVLKV